jgi:exopolysaccharide production protein ExoZ
MTEAAEQDRFIGIQILRGLAAASVVAFHLGGMARLRAGFDESATLAGAAGVDLFFVISGFIMIHTTRRGLNPRDFLRRRFSRIVPLYALVTLLAYAESLLGAHGGGGEALWRLAAALAFIPSYNSKGEIAPVFEPGWTLHFEAFFYLALALAATIVPRRRLAVLCVLLVGAVAAGALLSPRNGALACWSHPLLLEFLAGCLIAHVHATRRWTPPPKTAQRTAVLAILFGVSLLLFAAFHGAGRPHWIDHWRFLVWGAPAAAIVAGFVALERTGVFSRFAGAALWGERSYALYLTHPFVISAAGLALRGAPDARAVALPAALAAFLLSLALAALVHARVERPLQQRFQAKWMPVRVKKTRQTIMLESVQ